MPSCFVLLVGVPAWVRACAFVCGGGGACMGGSGACVRGSMAPPPLPPPLPSAPQGIRNETLGSVHGLHTPRFLLDEGVLPAGAALHASLAVRYLQQYNAAAEGGAPRDEL